MGCAWPKTETYKEKASTEGSSDLRNIVRTARPTSEPSFSHGNPSQVSVGRASRERRKDDNVHLYMSLAESPLNLIFIPNVELGLDGDNGPGILFPAGGCFGLDIHDDEAQAWKWWEGEEQVGPGNRIDSFGAYISKRYHLRADSSPGSVVVSCCSHHPGSVQMKLTSPFPRARISAQGTLRKALQFLSIFGCKPFMLTLL